MIQREDKGMRFGIEYEMCNERGMLIPTEEIHHKLTLSEGETGHEIPNNTQYIFAINQA
jgi:hypothetical protein